MAGVRCGLFAATAIAAYTHPILNSAEKTSNPRIPPGPEIALFSGGSNRPLAADIARHLSKPLGRVHLSRFSDGEIDVKILDNVRGKDVYIIQSTSPPVNEHLVELLLMTSCLRRASAKRITAVVPYYGYARQDRKTSGRVPISSADVARLLEAMGVDRVVSCDLHAGQIQGFFGCRVPLDNLECSFAALDYFKTQGLVNPVVVSQETEEDNREEDLFAPVVVSPDVGGVYRAKMFLNMLTSDTLRPTLALLVRQTESPTSPSVELVGTVRDSDCVIIDDMIDTAESLCIAAEQLKASGARRIYAFATHGLFSGTAFEKIEASALYKVIVTNTIQLPTQGKPRKVEQIPVGMIIGEAVRRLHRSESMSELSYSVYV